jgi:hypothetical protein
MLVSAVPCGKRIVIVVSANTGAAMHWRILDSIRCHPIAKDEGEARLLPIHIDMPGFVVKSRSPVLKLPERTSIDAIDVAPHVDVDPDTYRRAIEAVLKAEKVDATLDPSQGDLIPLRVRGPLPVGWVRTIPCGASLAVVLGFSPDEATAAPLIERTKAARCLARGEDPASWPDATR